MRVLRAWVLAAVLAAPELARAGGEADALIDEGVTLREQGKDEDALDRFTRAYALSATPRARAQMALAEQALGRWSLAERHLEEAMHAASDAWIAKNHGALDSALTTIRTHLGDLMITSSADGAEVWIDGARVGTLPLERPLRVESGSHALSVRKSGFFSVERSVTVSSESLSREQITLVAKSAESSDDRTPVPKASGDGQRADGPPADPGKVQRSIGWGLLAGAAPFAIAGVIGVVGRAGQISTYNADATCPGIDKPNQPASCQSTIDSANTWQAVSIVGFVGAGVLAASGVVLVLTAPKATSRVACAPGVLAFSCGGVF